MTITKFSAPLRGVGYEEAESADIEIIEESLI